MDCKFLDDMRTSSEIIQKYGIESYKAIAFPEQSIFITLKNKMEEEDKNFLTMEAGWVYESPYLYMAPEGKNIHLKISRKNWLSKEDFCKLVYLIIGQVPDLNKVNKKELINLIDLKVQRLIIRINEITEGNDIDNLKEVFLKIDEINNLKRKRKTVIDNSNL